MSSPTGLTVDPDLYEDSNESPSLSLRGVGYLAGDLDSNFEEEVANAQEILTRMHESEIASNLGQSKCGIAEGEKRDEQKRPSRAQKRRGAKSRKQIAESHKRIAHLDICIEALDRYVFVLFGKFKRGEVTRTQLSQKIADINSAIDSMELWRGEIRNTLN